MKRELSSSKKMINFKINKNVKMSKKVEPSFELVSNFLVENCCLTAELVLVCGDGWMDGLMDGGKRFF